MKSAMKFLFAAATLIAVANAQSAACLKVGDTQKDTCSEAGVATFCYRTFTKTTGVTETAGCVPVEYSWGLTNTGGKSICYDFSAEPALGGNINCSCDTDDCNVAEAWNKDTGVKAPFVLASEADHASAIAFVSGGDPCADPDAKGFPAMSCLYTLVKAAVEAGYSELDGAVYGYVLAQYGQPGYSLVKLLADVCADTGATDCGTKAGMKAFISSGTKEEIQKALDDLKALGKIGEHTMTDADWKTWMEVYGILIQQFAPTSKAAEVYTHTISDEDLARAIATFYVFKTVGGQVEANPVIGAYFLTTEGQKLFGTDLDKVTLKGGIAKTLYNVVTTFVKNLEGVSEADYDAGKSAAAPTYEDVHKWAKDTNTKVVEADKSAVTAAKGKSADLGKLVETSQVEGKKAPAAPAAALSTFVAFAFMISALLL